MKVLRESAHVSAVVLCSVFGSLDAGLARAQTSRAQAETPSQASTAATATPSDEVLQEIVVTAEHRASDVQRTPVAISVRSGDDLKQQGRFTVQDILQDVPGVTALSQTDTVGGKSDNVGSSISIRGLTANQVGRGSIVATVPAVAYYVDGVYEGVGGDYDIDRVEILRGPQGTLYGRSATAGVVSVHTKNPTFGALGVDASAELGNYNLQHYTVGVNLPVSDTLALRVSANRYQRDGYDSARGGSTDGTSGRAKLLFKPNDSFSALLGAEFNDSSFGSGGIQYILTGPNSSSSNTVPLGNGQTHSRQYWGEFNLAAGPVVVTYLPTYRTFTQNTSLITPGPGGNSLSQPDLTPKDDFLTQELRVASRPGAKLTWQAGMFYYENNLHSFTSLSFLSNNAEAFDATNDRHTQNYGVFAEATYPFADTWRVTGGVRYDYTYVQNNETYNKNTRTLPAPLPPFPDNPPIYSSLTISGDAATRKFDNFTYKARIEHDFSPTSLAYGMVSTGFLPGDVQIATGSTGLPQVQPYKSETVTSFELGTKNRFLDRRLQVNAAMFYYNFGGYQTDGINVSNNPLLQYFTTVNIPARMYGGELELLYKPTRHDQLQLDYSYTNAYFVDRPVLVPNKQFTNVAPHTVNAAYTHTFDLSDGSQFALHGDARYLSAHDVNSTLLTPTLVAQGAFPYVRQGGYVIGDAMATWTTKDGKFSITGYVRNIGDERTKADVLVQTISPLDVSYTRSDPRTYGIVLAVHL